MTNPFSLLGKTILVTGASSGIGRTIAIECSKLGAQLVLSARNEDALKETLSELRGENHKLIVSDLSTENGCKHLSETVTLLDGCVFNAGVSKMQPIQFYSTESIEEVFKVNTFAPMLLLKHLLKSKKINKMASIVFTSSISGNSNISPALGIYGASKSAITAYMKYAALELSGRGIRCNAIHPGRVNTTLISNRLISKEDLEKDIKQYPLHRYAEPEEVAYAAIYLLSDASSFVTGTSIIIDGGRSLK